MPEETEHFKRIYPTEGGRESYDSRVERHVDQGPGHCGHYGQAGEDALMPVYNVNPTSGYADDNFPGLQKTTPQNPEEKKPADVKESDW